MLSKLPNSLLTFLAGCFIQACTLVQGIIVARLLGPVGRGEFAAAILPAMFLGGVGLVGVNLVLTRLAANAPADPSLRRSALVVGLMTGTVNALAGLALCYLFLPAEQHHLLPLAQFFLLMIPLQHLSLNFLGVLQGMADFHFFNVARSVFNISYVAALLILALVGTQNLWFFLSSLLLANLAIVSWLMVGLFKSVPLRGPLFPVQTILKQSLPYAGFVITDMLYQWLDKILLLWLLGSDDLGLYMVAMSAAGATSVLTISLGVVAFTRAAQHTAGGGFASVSSSFRLAVILSVIIGVPFLCAVPFLVTLVFGRQFQPAIMPAMILVLSTTATGLTGLLGQSLQGQGRPLLCTLARAAFVPAFLVAGWVGARMHGLVGLSVGMVVAQVIVLFLHILFVRRHYQEARMLAFLPKRADVTSLIDSARLLVARLRPGSQSPT